VGHFCRRPKGVTLGQAHGIAKLNRLRLISALRLAAASNEAYRFALAGGGRTAAIADADRSCGPPQRAACPTVRHRRYRMKTKYLLNGVAVIAALAFSWPVLAQPANPSGRMPAGGRATSEPTNIPSTTSASDATSATPPKHHHHAGHATHAAAHHRMAHATSSTANQLNQQELARLQTGSSVPPPPMGAMPPPGPPPSPSGGNSLGLPGPNAGGPGLTPYSTGTPQR
jgi:hypothetical protein